MPNAKLERDVLDELLWDESINPSRIDVSANGGEVTLSGQWRRDGPQRGCR
jgi:osmotically-inducible protein OsmY